MSPDLHSAVTTWPAPADKPIRLRVSASAESGLRRGHPWLYAERIQEQSRDGRPGDLAVVYDRKRAFLALGLFDPTSPIRLRVLRARKPGPIDRAFFEERVTAALARRAELEATDTNGYRLIHGESDGMPGFVADRYADTLVIKLYSAAWFPHLEQVLGVLLEQQPARHSVLRLARLVSAETDALGGLRDGMTLHGEAGATPLVYREHGVAYEVDPVFGQKTGCFLDQRDNRARVGELAAGKRVLNVFSYTGGFSLSAARGGASEVCSLDLSGPALEAARRNFELNADVANVSGARHETLKGDAFAALAELAAAGRRFDLIVIDPPSFARRRAQVENALTAYARLASLGLSLLVPDGTIALASCSAPVSTEAFRDTVSAAALRVGRPLRDITETGHGVDHPTDFAESRYLKCLFATA